MDPTQLGTNMVGGGADHNSTPRYPTRTRITTPYPASAGGRRGRTPRSGRNPGGPPGSPGPTPCPRGPAPTTNAAPYSARPPPRHTPQRRRGSRPHGRPRPSQPAPRRTGLDWSPRPPKAQRAQTPPASSARPSGKPSGTRWHLGWYPPRTARPGQVGGTRSPAGRPPPPG